MPGRPDTSKVTAVKQKPKLLGTMSHHVSNPCYWPGTRSQAPSWTAVIIIVAHGTAFASMGTLCRMPSRSGTMVLARLATKGFGTRTWLIHVLHVAALKSDQGQ